MKNIVYDAKIAAYILNPTSKYTIDAIARDYLEIDNEEYLQSQGVKDESNMQTSLFDTQNQTSDDNNKIKTCLYAQEIYKLSEITLKKLEEIDTLDLFKNHIKIQNALPHGGQGKRRVLRFYLRAPLQKSLGLFADGQARTFKRKVQVGRACRVSSACRKRHRRNGRH